MVTNERLAAIVFFCLGDIDESLNSLDQESPKLIEAIKRRMFAPDLNVPYNFPVKDEGALMVSGQYGQVSRFFLVSDDKAIA